MRIGVWQETSGRCVCEFVKQSQIIEVLKSRFNKSFGERTAESPYVSGRMVAGFSLTIGSEL